MEIESPVTGQAISSLTSPTYTLVAEQALDLNQKAYYVSALGGTQTSVDAHSIVKPFQLILSKPKSIKMPTALTMTAIGQVTNVPSNEHKVLTRKGCAINSNGGLGRILIETRFVIPVGVPYYDAPAIAAAISLHVGAIKQDANDFVTVISNGTI